MAESKKRPRSKSGAQLVSEDHLTNTNIDADHEADGCDVIATDLTLDEYLPVAKGGVA